jgi:hypothetical protein
MKTSIGTRVVFGVLAAGAVLAAVPAMAGDHCYYPKYRSYSYCEPRYTYCEPSYTYCEPKYSYCEPRYDCYYPKYKSYGYRYKCR